MEVVFIDANIFLEIVLKDKRSDDCKKFLYRVLNEEIKAYTNDFIVYSCLLHVQRTDKSKMKDFIVFLNSFDMLEIIRCSFSDMIGAIGYINTYNLDFDDALVVSSMLKNSVGRLVSFDKHFDKVKGIERVEPAVL